MTTTLATAKRAEPTVARVAYSFASAELAPEQIAAHEQHARQALAARFDLADDAVKVAARPRLPFGEPFSLTCYTGASSTDAPAMVRAAQSVLPHLRQMQRAAAARFVAQRQHLTGSLLALRQHRPLPLPPAFLRACACAPRPPSVPLPH